MPVRYSIDRTSFQQLLADAFELQECRLSPGSLSALTEVQRLIAKHEPNTDHVIQLIAERARLFAGADGVAIALMDSNHLVYKAGSGCAHSYIGRRTTAVLSSSRNGKGRTEILRVDNAETDPRIEASICRQFEMQSLLILPIYKSEILGGVLEVFFTAAHIFEQKEIRTYRLMARLIEDLISDHEQQLARKKATENAAEHSTGEVIIHQEEGGIKRERDIQLSPLLNGKHRGNRDGDECRLYGGTNRLPNKVTPTLMSLGRAWQKVAAFAILAATLMSWAVYLWERRLSREVALEKKQAVIHNVCPPSGAPSGSLRQRSEIMTTPYPRLTKSAFKRVQVGPDEIDYIADDVTVRTFLHSSAWPQPKSASRKTQVEIGDDVTVRYFPGKSSIALRSPNVSAEPRGTGGSLPTSK